MIYVLSDIHGNERRFASVLEQIRLQPEDTLYVLGDVIDRHPGGIRILQKLMQMPNVKMLLGNHEYMMLRALGHPFDGEKSTFLVRRRAKAHWYRNGGQVTYRAFWRLPKGAREQIIAFLQALPLRYDIAVNGVSYRLVHGAPEEAYVPGGKYKNPVHFAVWKRWERTDTFPEGPILVFGHTPTQYYQDQMPMQIWRKAR